MRSLPMRVQVQIAEMRPASNNRKSRWGDGPTGRMKPCKFCGKEFYCIPFRDKPGKNEQKFCNSKCSHAHLSASAVYDPKRFWAKVDKSGGPDACWPYTGYITPEGYGWAYTGLPAGQQQTHGAHRQAWINTYGPIPKGLQVCHHCDNPPCCNPKHLFTGTNKDNTLDMLHKERHRRKLSADQVRQIRKAFVRTHKNNSNIPALAKRYGITPGAVRAVVLRLTWAHIS